MAADSTRQWPLEHVREAFTHPDDVDGSHPRVRPVAGKQATAVVRRPPVEQFLLPLSKPRRDAERALRLRGRRRRLTVSCCVKAWFALLSPARPGLPSGAPWPDHLLGRLVECIVEEGLVEGKQRGGGGRDGSYLVEGIA
jgi:hypothetical protein